MKTNRRNGATLGLAVGLILILVLLGGCLFFLVRLIGGGKQVANATDAGALAAARSVMTVALASNDSNVGTVFQGLGVDPHTGTPDPTDKVAYNKGILAYNRAAAAAILIAMNAVNENNTKANSTALTNANTVIAQLQTFGNALNTAIINSGLVGGASTAAFASAASANNVTMLGPNSSTNLLPKTDLQFTAVKTGVDSTGGASNIYFNSNTFGPYFSDTSTVGTTCVNTLTSCQDTTGSLLSSSNSDANAPSYETGAPYQSQQPFIKAYEPLILYTPPTSSKSSNPSLLPIYLCALNPSSTPHLIDSGRFSSNASQNKTAFSAKNSKALLNGSDAQIGYAPVNAVFGQTQTADTYNNNSALRAAAAAIVSAICNQYAAQLPEGWVRVSNGPNALAVNTKLPTLYGSVDWPSIIHRGD